jgi:hypothetical protein
VSQAPVRRKEVSMSKEFHVDGRETFVSCSQWLLIAVASPWRPTGEIRRGRRLSGRSSASALCALQKSKWQLELKWHTTHCWAPLLSWISLPHSPYQLQTHYLFIYSLHLSFSVCLLHEGRGSVHFVHSYNSSTQKSTWYIGAQEILAEWFHRN